MSPFWRGLDFLVGHMMKIVCELSLTWQAVIRCFIRHLELAVRTSVGQFRKLFVLFRHFRLILIRLAECTSDAEVRLETGHSKLRQKKIQWYHIKFTEGVHDYG